MELINKFILDGLCPDSIISALSMIYFGTRVAIFTFYALEDSSYVLNYYSNGSGDQNINRSLDEHTPTIEEINSYPIAEHILANLPLIDRGIAVDRLYNHEN